MCMFGKNTPELVGSFCDGKLHCESLMILEGINVRTDNIHTNEMLKRLELFAEEVKKSGECTFVLSNKKESAII